MDNGSKQPHPICQRQCIWVRVWSSPNEGPGEAGSIVSDGGRNLSVSRSVAGVVGATAARVRGWGGGGG